MVLNTIRGSEDAKTHPQRSPFPHAGDRKSTQRLNSTFRPPQTRSGRSAAQEGLEPQSKDSGLTLQKSLSVYSLSLLGAPVSPFPSPHTATCPRRGPLAHRSSPVSPDPNPGSAAPAASARPGQAWKQKAKDVRQIWRQIQAIPTHFGFVQVASERKVVSVRPNHSLRRQSKQMKFSL